jgi:hypothetical protein
VQPATFVVPGGIAAPALALGSSGLILVLANRQQLLAGAAALLAGAVLYLVNDRTRELRRPAGVPVPSLSRR